MNSAGIMVNTTFILELSIDANKYKKFTRISVPYKKDFFYSAFVKLETPTVCTHNSSLISRFYAFGNLTSSAHILH